MQKLKTPVLFSLFISLCFSLTLISCDKTKEKNKAVESSANVVQTKWEDIEEEKTVSDKKPVKKVSPKKNITTKKATKLSTPSKYQLQLGAFLKARNAAKLYKEMKQKGYNVTKVQNKSGSKLWHTVRITGFKTHLEAQNRAEQISKKESIEVAILRYNSFDKIVRKAPVKTTPPVVKKTTKTKFTKPAVFTKKKTYSPKSKKQAKVIPQHVGPKSYCFQVGGLLSPQVAIEQKNKLKKKGYNAFILKERDTMNNDEWSTVQIGYFQTLLKADQAAQEFFKLENIPTKARHIKGNS